MEPFAEKVISFFKELEYKGSLPERITIMNPFRDNPDIINVTSQFYRKFYNDYKTRRLILGINPGRFGAGVTGIPFTDTKRLAEKCGIILPGIETFETSSVFIYEMIDAYGGTMKFYSDYFISSVSPLGFTKTGTNGKEINYNYYDSKELSAAIMDFITENLKLQFEFGVERDVCYCLGTGQNFKFLTKLNNERGFFDKIIPLEHPRFVMQYKSKEKYLYIRKYIDKLQR
jgi:hypothetical protein